MVMQINSHGKGYLGMWWGGIDSSLTTILASMSPVGHGRQFEGLWLKRGKRMELKHALERLGEKKQNKSS